MYIFNLSHSLIKISTCTCKKTFVNTTFRFAKLVRVMNLCVFQNIWCVMGIEHEKVTYNKSRLGFLVDKAACGHWTCEY